ncbi:sec-independent protein translocase protein TatAd [bacterium BMS3Bbin06]|nr:sec-independent protein translocase protein TatAd [bacterium BMS3Abin08]GBE35121.1 sec-independent protein translocase protein TatAd [bacterium BMS3Bbin06]HDY71581.1 twin-arginine translocase subunit TatB [Nitrospirota bacterium]
MFDLGIQELIVIFVVALIIVGPQKLPELARSLGKGMAELKKTLQGVKEQIDSEMEEIETPIKDGLHDVADQSPFSEKNSNADITAGSEDADAGISEKVDKAEPEESNADITPGTEDADAGISEKGGEAEPGESDKQDEGRKPEVDGK